MIRIRHKLLIHLLRFADQGLLAVTLLLLLDIFGRIEKTGTLFYLLKNYYSLKHGLGILLLFLVWIWIFDRLVNYQTSRLKTLRTQVVDVIKAFSAAAFILFIIASAFGFHRIHNELVFLFWIGSCSAGVMGRILLTAFLKKVRRSGYNQRNLLLVGSHTEARTLANRINSTPELGYHIIGFVPVSDTEAVKIEEEPPAENLGDLSNLRRILETTPADEIMVLVPLLNNISVVWDIVRLGHEIGVVVRLFPESSVSPIIKRCHLEEFEGKSVVTFFREQLLLQVLGKKLLDLFGAALLLLITSPFLLLVAIAVKLTSPGPVFFIQERVGMNKRIFRLYKFRSMYINAEERRKELAHLNEMDGPVFKIRNDPRITPLGRFLRKSSLDEFPQLLNVLRGQMSLVGPRPPLPKEVDQYEWLFRKRLSIKPGITCLWQISGRNEISFKQWMEMDRFYVENWSLWLDLKILLKTIPAVLLQRGSS